MRPLRGKVVLLTGASRGLGVDMARAFARRGARLALAARSAGDLEAVRAGLGSAGSAIAIPADVGDLESLRSLVARTEEELGPVDVLVNNAGIEHVWDFEDESPETIERIITVNLTGLLWLTRLIVPSMIRRRSGHICNIASVAGLAPVPHNAVYSGSKHAVVGASRSLRVELRQHGVEVSVVCPGFVDGGMFAAWGRPPPRLTRAVTPQQVAGAVISAVERNRGEVVVAKGLAGLADVFAALAPELSGRAMELTGIARYLRDQASVNRRRARR